MSVGGADADVAQAAEVAEGDGAVAVDAAAVLVDGRSPTAIAKAHGLSRSWLYELISRFHRGGYEALEPRSRRPHSCSHKVDPSVRSSFVRFVFLGDHSRVLLASAAFPTVKAADVVETFLFSCQRVRSPRLLAHR